MVNFVGTDTIAALQLMSKYYDSPMAGFSIPAAEHSTITTWGRQGEAAAFRNMLTSFPVCPVSVVIDSYDTENAVSGVFGKDLHDDVINRKAPLVVRPDSGNPADVIRMVS